MSQEQCGKTGVKMWNDIREAMMAKYDHLRTCKHFTELHPAGVEIIMCGLDGTPYYMMKCSTCRNYENNGIQTGDHVYTMRVIHLNEYGMECLWGQESTHIKFRFMRFIIDRIDADGEMFEQRDGDYYHISSHAKPRLADAIKDCGLSELMGQRLLDIAAWEYAKSDPGQRFLWLEIYINRKTGKLSLTFEP